MKTSKKLFVRILLVLVALLVILFFTRNFVARKVVEVGVMKVTGFPLEIGSVNLGLFASKLDVHDLKLMNPPEFQEKMFVDMPQLYVDYRLASMLKKAPHINDMLINIKQLVIVTSKKGESNAKKLKGTVSSGDSSTKYSIDKLRVHVGTVTIKDFSRAKPSERNITLNVDATYNNITDATDITRLVLLTVMSQVHLPDIGIKVDDLKKGLGNAAKGAADTVEKAGKSLFDTINKAVPHK
ncbi:MAG: hypothetical protein ABSC38_03675 [Verrucomicrobiia bacterium]